MCFMEELQQQALEALRDACPARDADTDRALSDIVGKIGDGTILKWIIANAPQIIAIIKIFWPAFPLTPAA
jgi:hypothetical protein